MALTETHKTDVRRHLGYGPMGNPAIVQQSFNSYRFFTVHGLLEYRLNAMSATEEPVLIGSGNVNAPVNPNFTDPNTGTVYDGFINICNFLEGQIGASFDNLDTEKAGDWTARKDEVKAKQSLYFFWCRKLAAFMNVPMGYVFNHTFGSRGALVN